MTVPALLLVPAAAEDTPSPSTTAETAATEANLIPVICSPHSSALPTGNAGPEPSPAIDLERIYLLKYTSADIHVKRPRCAAAARRARTLLSWTSAVVNGPTGGPELAQIVTVRDMGEEAQIEHLELTDQARAIVGPRTGISLQKPRGGSNNWGPVSSAGFAPSVMVTATGLGPTKVGGIRMRRRATLIALVVALVGAALAGAAPSQTDGSAARAP
jgi:hypothetical protein